MFIRPIHFVTALLGLFLTACVTINVYFPAAAAEKAADQIIDQVWGEKSGATDKPATEKPVTEVKPATDKQSALPQSSNWFASVFELLIPSAQAEANIDVSSPTIQVLQNGMATRFKDLKAYYESGAVGLTADALVTLRDPSLVPLKNRNNVNRWVVEENNDRLALYRELALANGHPEWETEIRSTFASRWIERAAKGWWYQDTRGQWQRKP
ncbi:YdbL family protein [Beggiatoa leptomitoformis]|uniref:DUF1318 domain-containing protein n=1 Tax=Beggiatoa leptomitoformis TaxID=288004 RepID=A0A2N9YAJ5_9GAMM|nr:YdbL family protein [Beggiatoa leptomitoformis]ALG67119.1 DUF1318 domain-containing protein [Beggiatoa leptomitoformis]AUI67486.1 DUF1318 domain-containing protein [Beggiatoa leptomitoformis]